MVNRQFPQLLLVIFKTKSMVIFYEMSRKDHLLYGIASVKSTADLIINHLNRFHSNHIHFKRHNESD